MNRELKEEEKNEDKAEAPKAETPDPTKISPELQNKLIADAAKQEIEIKKRMAEQKKKQEEQKKKQAELKIVTNKLFEVLKEEKLSITDVLEVHRQLGMEVNTVLKKMMDNSSL